MEVSDQDSADVEEPVKYVDCRVEYPVKMSHFTGYFRDGKRRIDLVLVLKDSGSEAVEQLKIEFLMSMIDAGLDLEVEFAVMLEHKELVFVKIHLPEQKVTEYGRYYEAWRPFKVAHVDLIRPGRFLVEPFGPCMHNHFEREWINLMRVHYPGPEKYNTLERSQITYRLMQSIYFGEAENHFGLDRLLDGGVIADAFALHDGPYFFADDQKRCDLNGRQALYLTWTGYRNLIRAQPLHLIREYMGPRVAFLFTFHAAYIRALMFMVPLSFIVFILGFCEASDGHINSMACTNVTFDVELNATLCPKCWDFNVCPFLPRLSYCSEIRFKTYLDNRSAMWLSLVHCLWGAQAVVLWTRQERYLNFLWEVSSDDTVSIARTDHVIVRSEGPAWKQSMGKMIVQQAPSVAQRFLISVAAVIFTVFVMIPVGPTMVYSLMKPSHIWYTENNHRKIFNMVLTLVAFMYGIAVHFLEKVGEWLSHYMACAADCRTEEQHERILVTNLCAFSFMLNFGFIFYQTYIKGQLYTHPVDPNRWAIPLGLGVANCGMISCIDEAVIVFCAFNIGKRAFICWIHNRPEYTDLNKEKWRNMYAPCWEKEYQLKPYTEKRVMRHYQILILHIAMTSFLVSIFPLAPLVSFILSLWNIRHAADDALLLSRRPLLMKSNGLGHWHAPVFLLPYIAAFTNAVATAMQSAYFDYSAWERYGHTQFQKNDTEYLNHMFLTFCMGLTHTEEFDKVPPAKKAFKEVKGTKPKKCIFYNKMLGLPQKGPAKNYLFPSTKFYVNFNQTAYVILFVVVLQHAVVLGGLVGWRAWSQPDGGGVRRARVAEHHILRTRA